jgi:hypothetical protein
VTAVPAGSDARVCSAHATEGDRRAIGQGDASLGQQFTGGRQHAAAGARASVLMTEQRARAVTKGDGTELGGGIESKNPGHGGIVPAGVAPEPAKRRQRTQKTEGILEFKRPGHPTPTLSSPDHCFSSREPS